ncbi:bifunctional DNA primase/polymerase [Pseudonocardia halophobica]|uniref:bifunctional DNA primase/polymerase n=1 Tax=Pseudonocardia halophobica TaxID=29401 RepID=UPI003D91DE27
MRERSSFLRAALAAASRGWLVFPLVPGGKTPVVEQWEERATTDRAQIYRWWGGGAPLNIGVAAGRSGLVVVDLDGGHGDTAPAEFAGAKDGSEVFEILARRAGSEPPWDTYSVATPNGRHLYFGAPDGVELRNTVAALGWRVDTRAHGGYVVAAGSRGEAGSYRLLRRGPVAELPGWLVEALRPAPSPPPSSAVSGAGGAVLGLSRGRTGAYVRAIVEREAALVAAAATGTRHDTLLKAARTLGRLVGGGELEEETAREALLDAAAGHVGVDGCTTAEVARTVQDGLAYGRQLPRRIRRG